MDFALLLRLALIAVVVHGAISALKPALPAGLVGGLAMRLGPIVLGALLGLAPGLLLGDTWAIAALYGAAAGALEERIYTIVIQVVDAKRKAALASAEAPPEEDK